MTSLLQLADKHNADDEEERPLVDRRLKETAALRE
jgi:hypothetical protein